MSCGLLLMAAMVCVAECPPAARPPMVVDCTDARSSPWVQEMIGSCAMPRLASSTAAKGPARERPPSCAGSDCTRDAPPMSAATSGTDLDPSAALPSAMVTTSFAQSTLLVGAPDPLDSISRDRIDRPPR